MGAASCGFDPFGEFGRCYMDYGIGKTIGRLCLITFLALFSPAALSYSDAAEHPKEHPVDMAGQSGVTKENLAMIINAYVAKDAALKGGYFLFYDDKTKKPLVLSLDRVHEDRLSKVAADTYFACADFKTPTGKMYDLDIFMKGKDKNSLEVTEITVHKENGKERYKWLESDGVWSRVGVTPKSGGDEHPKGMAPGGAEHPAGAP